MKHEADKSNYTIPNKSMRTARLTNLGFALLFIGIAVVTFSNHKVISAIFWVVGLIALVRVFTLPIEYRKKS